MTILPQNPWNSSHLEHPREPRDTAKAGQRRKCHIIDLSECPSVAQAGQRRKCHIIDLSDYSSIAQAGQRRKCNRIDSSECSSAAQAGQYRKCNRIDSSECRIVIRLGSQSSIRNRYPGLRLGLEGMAFQAEDSDHTPNPCVVPGQARNACRRRLEPANSASFWRLVVAHACGYKTFCLLMLLRMLLAWTALDHVEGRRLLQRGVRFSHND